MDRNTRAAEIGAALKPVAIATWKLLADPDPLTRARGRDVLAHILAERLP